MKSLCQGPLHSFKILEINAINLKKIIWSLLWHMYDVGQVIILWQYVNLGMKL